MKEIVTLAVKADTSLANARTVTVENLKVPFAAEVAAEVQFVSIAVARAIL